MGLPKPYAEAAMSSCRRSRPRARSLFRFLTIDNYSRDESYLGVMDELFDLFTEFGYYDTMILFLEPPFRYILNHPSETAGAYCDRNLGNQVMNEE